MSGWDKHPEYGSPGSWWSIALSAAVVLALGFSLANCAQESAKAKAEVETTGASEIVGVASVIDGDTIEIHGQRIRLDGVDAPERNKVCGDTNVYQRASLALSDFIGAQTVHCAITDEPDRYGRQVAQCSVGGTDMAAHLVEQGWARDWPRYSDGAYADEEARARASHSGLWGLQCPSDLWGDRDYSR
ncbi:MAG: thermonuclease family protein [Deltaproteobacteria bacterium]|nr:thermonuclease family protein [Deltaproteobacteria bacterium]